MVQEAREFARHIRQESPDHKKGADLLEDFARSLGKQGLLPSKLPRVVQESQRRSSKNEAPVAAELNLDNEWQRQSQNFLELGFHVETGFEDTGEGKQAYLDSLPKFEPQPENYRNRFNVPLLVETKIPWEKQAQFAGIVISDYLVSRMNEIKPHDDRSKTPDTPYTGWFNRWGERFTRRITPTDARKELTLDEIGGGPYEGVAMQVAHPEITRSGKYFDLIGYDVGSGSIPCLDRWGGVPGLGAGGSGSADGFFRPLVRGSKIVTG